MALVTYDVTATTVLKWLAQLATGNATIPGTSDITDEWIQLAAAEVEDAMLEGGLSSASVAAATTPSAYYQLRHLVARLAALYYAEASALPVTDGLGEQWRADCKARLAEISSGRRVGELTATDGQQAARYYSGRDSTDEDTLDDNRATIDGAL